ncbi:MAG: SpoIIE family protein phosphatase [Eubacteriales bacterium]|nr:SpoIIE family protein phosphatase [Eubacteriales bacterium]
MEKRRLIKSNYKRQWTVELIGFALALLLCRIRVAGTFAPFALSVLIALSLGRVDPLLAFLGLLIGAVIDQPPQFCAMLVGALYIVLTRIYILIRKNMPAIPKVLLAVLCCVATLPFSLTNDPLSLCYALLSMAMSIVGGITLFQALSIARSLHKRRALSELEQTMLLLTLALALLGLGDVSYFGVSLPVVAILFSSMVAVYAKGVSGALIGILLSVALVIGAKAEVQLVGSMAFCMILAALASKLGVYAIVGAFFLGGLLLQTYWMEGLHVVNAQNILLSSIPFLLLPKEWLLMVSGYLNSKRLHEYNSALAIRRMQLKTADEMIKTASICRDIAELFVPNSEEAKQRNMLKQWTVHGAMRVCAECPARVLCWKDADAMGEAILKVLPAFDKGEIINTDPPIDKACTHLPSMLASAYLSYNQALAQQANTVQIMRQYAFVNRQLKGVGQVIGALAERVKEDKWVDNTLENELVTALERKNIPVISVDALYPNDHLLLRISVDLSDGMKPNELQKAVANHLRRPMRLLEVERKGTLGIFEMEEAQQLRASMAVASIAEQADGICGDATGEFRLPSGRVLYALSDGMGSGAEAHKESTTALELLFNLYRIGFSKELVYENVNRLLLTRAGTEMYATLDAVALDLFNSEAEFVKFGAPPTYLLRNEKLKILSGEALPCGIVDEAKPSILQLKLKKDDVVVLLSDGVFDVLGELIERTLIKNKGADNKTIANAVMSAALQKGQRDDMTVMVIHVA